MDPVFRNCPTASETRGELLRADAPHRHHCHLLPRYARIARHAGQQRRAEQHECGQEIDRAPEPLPFINLFICDDEVLKQQHEPVIEDIPVDPPARVQVPGLTPPAIWKPGRSP